MSVLDEMRSLERQQFFNGQRLFAADLQELEAFHREMRWLHNESLHQPGIGNGFAVGGNKGDREVVAGPGYAIDASGREIALIEDRVLQVPPLAAERDGSPVFFDLTVAYPEDAMLEEAETRAGICRDRGTVRLREEPVFCWVRLKQTDAGTLVAADARLGAEVEQGLRLVIGRIEVLNCQLNRDVSLAQRRDARPSPLPVIACGSHKPDPWELIWFVDDSIIEGILRDKIIERVACGEIDTLPVQEIFGTLLELNLFGVNCLPGIVLPFALRATVPTADAGFKTTPCYNVRMDGSRISGLVLRPEENGEDNGDNGEGPF